MHPQTTEVIEKKNEEDLMDLVLKLNDKLEETVQELEKTVQNMKSELTSQPQNVIPMVSKIAPSAFSTALPPNVPLATNEIIEELGIGTSQVGTSNQSIEELINSMEGMKL